MNQIKTIIFDLGGVILNIDPSITERKFLAYGAQNWHQYFGHGFASAFFLDYEVGALTDEEFIGKVRSLAGVNLSDEEITGAWNALLLDFPPERIAFLKSLATRYDLYLFSNTNAIHLVEFQRAYKQKFHGESLDELFKKAYYSHVLQMRKPDKASFEYIIRENQLDPGTTLFVDDALVNIEGARSAGLVVHHLLPGTTILDLKL